VFSNINLNSFSIKPKNAFEARLGNSGSLNSYEELKIEHENKEDQAEKKKRLYNRIEKLKDEVTNKNSLKSEVSELKEMQKLLIKRLEQQDEYLNQSMYGK
jgi:hypothetical protein